MLRTLLVCGLLAGLCAGLLAAGFASVTGEPAVRQAIAFEDVHASGHEDDHPAPVSRALQESAGLLTASIVFGVSLGGLFALAFAFAYGRVGRASPAATAGWLALAAFVTVYLVPFLKYPANPPAVGDPDTIGRRTALYAVMIAISLLAAIAAARIRPALLRHVGSGAATVLAVGAYVAVVTAGAVALPGVHEVPRGFPATTLWHFREASVGMQAVLWASIGLVFAVTAQRVMTGRPLLAFAR